MAVVVTEVAPAPARAPAAAPHMEQFRRLFEARAAGRAASLDEELRAAALAELLAAGFPLRRDEEWVHTPLRAVAEARYRLGSAVPAPAADGRGAELLRELVAGEPVALLTCNGALASPAVLAPLTGGAHGGGAGGGRGRGQSDIAGVRGARGDLWPRCREAFTRPLTTAFSRLARAFGDHAVLHCDAAAGVAPLHLVHLVEAGVLAAPRVTIRIAEGARVTLVESCVAVQADPGGATGAAAAGGAAANGTAPGRRPAPSAPAATGAGPNGAPWDGRRAAQAASLSCADTEIRVGAGASLTYVRVQAAGAEAFDFGTTTVVQERDSELHALSVALGGRIARHTCNVLAAAPGTASRLGGVTAATGGQVLDHHTYVEHAAPGCASRQLYKTVLGRGGHGVFSGRILVRPVAQQTDAFQLNQNLLLDDARVDTKPQLEIGADDVRCTHGATTGRLNEDQLFYLQARAIERSRAVRMLARGFLDEVVGELPAAALRPRLLKLLHRRLDRIEGSIDR
ncbi:MAG: SufD family Fe-S cluster assembly protein [Spirochaetaceae bacterium]|nr:SufD family Fe-S cluster assembly protein [Spirochaetaceae bacterium]